MQQTAEQLEQAIRVEVSNVRRNYDTDHRAYLAAERRLEALRGELAEARAEEEAERLEALEEHCICGDDGLVMHLWPLFSFEELRDPACPIHPNAGDLG